jgi:hypothetical protein
MNRLRAILVVGFALAACASPAPTATSTLVAADAATSLAVGERITEERQTLAAGEGQDPLVNLALRHADGRRLAFQEGNHTPEDVMAQSAGGALAQIMGLPDDATPTLFRAASGEASANEGAFFCGPQGPAAIGRYETADGAVRIVGLRQNIQFETRPDGQMEALPYSPDQVCARLAFRRG